MNNPAMGDIFQSNQDNDLYEFINTLSIQETRNGNYFQYPAFLLRNIRTNEVISIGSSQFSLFYQFVDEALLDIDSNYKNEDLIRDFLNFYNDALGAEYVKKLNDRIYNDKLAKIAERIVDNFEDFRLGHCKHIKGITKPGFHSNTRNLLKDFALNLLLLIEISNNSSK